MLVPADKYKVVKKSIITEYDKEIIMNLYQPIIGCDATSLYFTLSSDTFYDCLNHQHLISLMKTSLGDIDIAKEKLEAVGLIETYYKKDDLNNYIYLIYAPLPAIEFLNHPVLNILLYNNLGKNEYDMLVSRYRSPRIDLKEYDNITHKIDEVFSIDSSKGLIVNKDLLGTNTNDILLEKEFDFDLLLSSTNSKILNDKWLTKEVKDLISKLSFVYNIDVLNMKNIILASINNRGLIDKDLLRKNSRNYYQFENEGNLPKLIYKKQPEYLRKTVGDSSRRSKMIYVFENVNPHAFLKSKYKDGKVTTRDLKIIEDLLVDQKLYPGVVNVLIDYVLKINNQKLNKTYIDTIAGHWKRLGIETVEDAMNLCEKEHSKMKNKITKDDKKIPTSVTPEWFDKELKKENMSDDEAQEIKDLLENF